MYRKEHSLLLGAHMSIAGGFEKAIERGSSIGCTAIQIFTKSNRQWHAKSLTKQEIDLFQQAKENFNIEHIIAHASYLINLGSPNDSVSKKSTHAVASELERCQQLGIKFLVVHPGAHLNTDIEQCLTRIAHNIDTILTTVPGETTILLENMAGQGSIVCSSFEQLAFVLDHITMNQRVGICFDTAHAFAAGYDFREPTNYKSMWQQFDDSIGLHRLKTIHLNDSKKNLGSHIDRHEHIGKGMLGLNAFRLLLNDIRFIDIPKILETPKESLQDDAINMKILKELVST